MGRSVSLDAYRPVWIQADTPFRWGMGVQFDCPNHGAWCRLNFWFCNPADGGEPVAGTKLWHRIGSGLGQLTVTERALEGGMGLGRPLYIKHHWMGWLIDSRVRNAIDFIDPEDTPTEPSAPIHEEPL